MDKKLTSKQRFWYEHIQRCEQLSMPMSAYAAEHSLDLKRFYNWKWTLAKRGVIGDSAVSHAQFTEVRFHEVNIGSAWRVRFPNGCVLESDQANESLLSCVVAELSRAQ